jgi:hypothetical protein
MAECPAMKTMIVVLLFAALAFGKDSLRVEVIAVHSVTHEDRGGRAALDKAILGAHAPTTQRESFNIDAKVNGENVLLACDDPKGCESPAVGTYDGEIKRGKWLKLTFPMPLSGKSVTRWYRIAGSW